MATSRQLIQQAITDLTESDAPDLDGRWLLAHLLQIDHRDPKLRQDFQVEESVANNFLKLLKRRGNGEPLAHLLGEWEFYGHAFEVTPTVLVPRPETELLVDWALQILKSRRQPRVAEIGVGSLAVIGSLAIERPDLRGVGVEICADALTVAKRNAAKHHLEERLQLVLGSHFDPLEDLFDLVVANPPYVIPGDPQLQSSVAAHEPEVALLDHIDGDGLGHYRLLIEGLAGRVHDHGGLLLECGQGQADSIAELARQQRWQVEIRQDLASIPRALYLHSRSS
ncbi:MAG: protein-(glutamine-N5) methyltransferase, release factor-specific [Planctomycetia bacterium TMED53]|nr:MAG: protein-(glutamine-N5) methyltransferase, release factor-specific [Planctomycetia bacterium TMED53]